MNGIKTVVVDGKPIEDVVEINYRRGSVEVLVRGEEGDFMVRDGIFIQERIVARREIKTVYEA